MAFRLPPAVWLVEVQRVRMAVENLAQPCRAAARHAEQQDRVFQVQARALIRMGVAMSEQCRHRHPCAEGPEGRSCANAVPAAWPAHRW